MILDFLSIVHWSIIPPWNLTCINIMTQLSNSKQTVLVTDDQLKPDSCLQPSVVTVMANFPLICKGSWVSHKCRGGREKVWLIRKLCSRAKWVIKQGYWCDYWGRSRFDQLHCTAESERTLDPASKQILNILDGKSPSLKTWDMKGRSVHGYCVPA